MLRRALVTLTNTTSHVAQVSTQPTLVLVRSSHSRHITTVAAPVSTKAIANQTVDSLFVPARRKPRFTWGQNVTLRSAGPDPRPLEERPVVLLLNWLGAEQKAVEKYIDLYTNEGCDIVSVIITPWQFMRPARGRETLCAEIADGLLSHPVERPLFVHSMSVGGWIFSEFVAYVNRVKHIPGHRHRDVERMIHANARGQVWDSFVDVAGAAPGISHAITTFLLGGGNRPVEKGIELFVRGYMRATESVATKYYRSASAHLREKPLPCPALIFCSREDPISTLEQCEILKDAWVQRGIQTRSHEWRDTKHVKHMKYHPEEYKNMVTSFLKNPATLSKLQLQDPGQ